eukprot:scaffold39077_cov72-Cyclotella_meneghiniana.AAC.8
MNVVKHQASQISDMLMDVYSRAIGHARIQRRTEITEVKAVEDRMRRKTIQEETVSIASAFQLQVTSRTDNSKVAKRKLVP